MSETTRPLADATLAELIATFTPDHEAAKADPEKMLAAFDEASQEILFRARGITKDNVDGDKLNLPFMRELDAFGVYIVGFSVQGVDRNHMGLRHRETGVIIAHPTCYR